MVTFNLPSRKKQ